MFGVGRNKLIHRPLPTRDAPVHAPAAFRDCSSNGNLALRRRLPSPSFVAVGFTLMWLALAAAGVARLREQPVTWLSVLVVVFSAIGAGLAYSLVLSMVGSVEVSIERDALKVHYHPLPWPGCRIARSRVSRVTARGFFLSDGTPTPDDTFTVGVDLQGASHCVLLDRLTEDEATYLEHRLAAYLGA